MADTIIIHRRLGEKPVLWEVVLYRKPRHLECYCHRFKTKQAAMLFAELNQPNPNWSEIHVHAILKEFAGLTFTHQ